MNAKISNELLSAYFDGETSSEEDALVEEALETSTELRRQLDELGLVSELLRSLPRETAPVELSAAVRRQAEREMLLPPPAPPARPASPQRSSRWRNGVVVAGTSAVTAAALLLILNLAGGPDAQPMNAVQHAAELSPDEAADVAHTAEQPPTPMRTANAEAQSADGTAGGRPKLVGQRESHDEAQLSSKSAPPVPSPPSSDAASASTVPRPGAFADGVKVGRLQPGDVVRYLETSDDDDVTVLEVTVIDVQRALGALQVLFAKNAIVGESEAGVSVKADAQQRSTPPADRLYGVYVEATDDQLASTLNEMNSPEIFVEIKRHSSVTFEELQSAQENETARRRLAVLQSRAGDNTRSRRQPADGRDGGKTVAQERTKPKVRPLSPPEPPVESPQQPAAARRAADDEAPDSEADGAQSFQITVTLPVETLRALYRRSNTVRGPTRRTDADAQSETDSPADAESDTQPAPRRVVFVLHEQHPGRQPTEKP